MVFSSLFFICMFLPLNLFAYYIPKTNKVRNIVMLVFSIIFYAWGEPLYVLLLLAMTFSCWFFALRIDASRGKNDKKAKQSMILATVIALSLIGIFKYTPFLLGNVKAITGFPENIPNIPLPIGISFYTFQLLTYVIDVYRGDAPVQKRYADLLLYASLFHQCIAGPIVRYSDIAQQINDRVPTFADFNKGVMRFSTGLAKKVMLANVCGSFADNMLVADGTATADALTKLSSSSALTLWFGILFYMLQIYLDFSAYSDMAIGMGQMTGFKYKENFDYPYISKSVSEFWRRWHISLGSFFRDYVYIPLGGNRKGKIRTIINLFVVWALTGLWHGASWNFVLWGIYFFIFIAAEKLFLEKRLKKLPVAVSRIYLLLVVYFGWVLFKFEDMSVVGTVLKGMFCLNGNPISTYEAFSYVFSNIIFIVVAIIACTPFVKYLRNYIDMLSSSNNIVNTVYNIFRAVIPAVLVILSAICLVGDSYNPFLYFRF